MNRFSANHIINLFWILLAGLALTSCSASKSTGSGSQPAGRFFVAGYGGGFTGLYNQYRIYENGQVEKFNFEGDAYLPHKKISPEKVKKFFREIDKLKLESYRFDQPGNLTEYLEIYSKDGSVNKIAWPKGSGHVDPAVSEFFKETIKRIETAGN